MTYTDEDILDLYTCLQGIGLAETPAEEAHRHYTDFINSVQGKHITRPLECYFRDYLLRNQIPHSYASTFSVIKDKYCDSCIFFLYFVIRGQIFSFKGRNLTPLDPIPPGIVFHQDSPSLLQHIKTLRGIWPFGQGRNLNLT